MAKLRKILSTDDEVTRRKIGCIDVQFAGCYIDGFKGDEHLLEIWPDSMEDRVFGYNFAVPDRVGPGRYLHWVPFDEKEPLSVEEIEDGFGNKAGITIYKGEHPLVSIISYNTYTYVYAATQPKELNGSSIELAPLALMAKYNKDGEKEV